LACARGLALAIVGDVDRAERAFADEAAGQAGLSEDLGRLLAAWAQACLWAGQPNRAFEMSKAAVERATVNPSELVLATLARAWAEVELGRAPTQLGMSRRFGLHAGAAAELAGLAALARRDHAAAAAAFDLASERWSGFQAPRAVLCRWAAGQALLQAGQRDGAIERLRAAEAAAERLGFEPLAARARRSLRCAGERPGRPASIGRTGGLLTGREREVLGLVERGLTNAEIARRMSLGRPTVARLVSNAMLRLGAESRAQAVVLAARMSTKAA
jgi:DNA-binding CsgD family transcriptional regulator